MNTELQAWIEGFQKEINNRFEADLKVVAYPKNKSDKVDIIANVVASVTDISVDAMKGKRRDKFTANARHIAMYLCSVFTKSYTTNIGRYFNRDHTTVIHAVRLISDRQASNDELTMCYLPDCIDILKQTFNESHK